MVVSAKKILENHPVEASAPCRIDSGGTWDIKAMALPLEKIQPVTVNMALNLRTRVELSPWKENRVKVSSEGFQRGEEYMFDASPFHGPFGIFFAALSHFGFHGIHVKIRSDSPVKSALGGSSTALVALIKALSRLGVEILGGKELSGREILHLGYHLEDGINGGNCGIQDQAAAVFGGVNQWTWGFGKRTSMFKRESLLDRHGREEISDRILVAHSGRSHVSARINRSWVNAFLDGTTRAGWIRVNDITARLAWSIKKRDWETAASLLRDEMALRRKITPDALIPITEQLIDQAESTGCGARFTGAGAGGAVWALGEPVPITRLRDIWSDTLSPVRSGKILDCAIDSRGVRIEKPQGEGLSKLRLKPMS